MKKRSISFFTVLIIIFALLQSFAYASLSDTSTIFTDIKAKDWYKKYVDYTYSNGLFTGMTKTTFAPGSNITRAQFVQVLSNIDGVKDIAAKPNVFKDVKASSWYAAAVTWASENKIVSGMGDGTFLPNANVTREQMCVLLTNYANYKGHTLKAVEEQQSFADDSKISKWAKNAVYTCQQADIVNGKGAGTFDPQGTGTRAEACVMFTKYHKDYLVNNDVDDNTNDNVDNNVDNNVDDNVNDDNVNDSVDDNINDDNVNDSVDDNVNDNVDDDPPVILDSAPNDFDPI